ncbi:division/cell wall cluster transcriptional repressor MraZ [Anaeropeptidivorans aminofermentans]|uniref:division/cell wall cluster transcriptional repressor MraZ n=1 Tax=Anaeropeptidivorans aminofermentans TaxID=2934315 RepID=UPI0020253905|nr:division/cell wall cluster transcriptional repressor MraZ [Anaeropeptidivorans aminofermentans]MBE6011243.1 division/cell wall cluster transcriptional repressor MraZ [Lachnospiraceae bacterium]
MFLGEYQHSLDGKGRLIVPSKFREGLGERFIITKSLDKCLSIYTISEWTIFTDKLKSLPSSDAGVRRFQRFFIGGAVECEPDNQNRILIPSNLREYAQIIKEIVSVGLTTKIEIWSKESWEAYNSESDFIDGELADRMAQLGI